MKRACSRCFKSLGVDSRNRIYDYISQKGGANVSDITAFTGLKQPTVSYHLKEMFESGLLDKVSNGKEMIYKTNHSCPHDGKKCIVVE